MNIKFKNILFLIISVILLLIFLTISFNGTKSQPDKVLAEDINNFGVINGGYEGFYLFDLNTNEIIKKISTGNYINKIELHEKFIYLTDSEGLKIYSITDDFEIELVNTFKTYGESLSLVKNDKYIYLADGNNGIVIFELDKDIFIRFLHHIKIDGIVIDLIKKDDYIFALGPKFGLKVYEIVDNGLKEITSYNSLISPSKIYTNENTLFIKDDILGLLAFDIQSIINNINFKSLYKLNFQIGDLSPISRDIFYFTDSEGLKKYDAGNIELIHSDNLLRANINYKNERIYISKKEKGFEIFDLKKEKIIYEHNVLSYINNFNINEEGIYVEDSGVIHFFDRKYNLKWSKEIEGKVLKVDDGLIVYKGDSVSVIKNENISTKNFGIPIYKTVNDNEKIWILSEKSIISFDEEKVILNGFYTDIMTYNGETYVTDQNYMYKMDPLTKNLKKIFYSANEIKSIEAYKGNIFIMTEYGIQYLDKEYNPTKFFSYSYYPDNYVFENGIFYMTIQNKVILLNTQINNLFSEYEFKIPIVDIDIFKGEVYISHSSYGIERFKINDNLELELIDSFQIFNANNFYLQKK